MTQQDIAAAVKFVNRDDISAAVAHALRHRDGDTFAGSFGSHRKRAARLGRGAPFAHRIH